MVASVSPTHPAPASVRRFSGSVRAIHWATAVLMIACIATAAILYNGVLGIAVGHRRMVEQIHVYCGFSLPVPVLLGTASRAWRGEIGRLNRFTRSDWRWLRSRSRRDGTIRVGKFNAGQKLNAALVAGSILVLLGTGLLMYYPSLVRLTWRTGATFVHDWSALAVGLLVLGHLGYALSDREALRAMVTGNVSAEWAERQHAAWADELDPPGSAEPASP